MEKIDQSDNAWRVKWFKRYLHGSALTALLISGVAAVSSSNYHGKAEKSQDAADTFILHHEEAKAADKSNLADNEDMASGLFAVISIGGVLGAAAMEGVALLVSRADQGRLTIIPGEAPKKVAT